MLGILLAVGLLVFVFRRSRANAREQRAAEQRAHASDQRLAALVTSIGDGVVAIDREGRVEYMNATAITLSAKSLDDARGVAFADVFAILDEDTDLPILFDRDCAKYERCVLERRDGSIIPVALSAAPIHDAEGISGTIVTIRDAKISREHARRLEAQRRPSGSSCPGRPHQLTRRQPPPPRRPRPGQRRSCSSRTTRTSSTAT
jgi:PAS domain S-box-containing protein